MPASPPRPEEASEIEEEVRDFSKRFARLVVSRAFRENGITGASVDTKATPGDGQQLHATDATTRGRSALVLSTLEAEMSLRGSQRLASQLQDDAEALRSRVLPSLKENARHLHALYVAIDRVTEHVMPEIEEAVARMEKATYDLEETRKEQVDTRIPQMSYGLGSPWGRACGRREIEKQPRVFRRFSIRRRFSRSRRRVSTALVSSKLWFFA